MPVSHHYTMCGGGQKDADRLWRRYRTHSTTCLAASNSFQPVNLQKIISDYDNKLLCVFYTLFPGCREML